MQPHEVLGVRRGATRSELAEAFRRHALRHHPDRGGDREAFEAGADAYHRLTGAGTPRPTAAAAPGGTPGSPPRADVVFHRRRPGLAALARLARRRRRGPRSLS